jgi:tetratricopeptide (TPR) repeat protein
MLSVVRECRRSDVLCLPSTGEVICVRGMEKIMQTSRWDAVWERARASKHTIVVGPETIPPAPDDLRLLRVRCHGTWTTGGPLHEACQRVEKLLGEEFITSFQAREQFRAGLRARLLDNMPERAIDAILVESCNRLAAWADGRVVLAFEAVDAADDATITTLTQIMRRPGWLQLPTVFAVQGVPEGPVSALIEALRQAGGEDAVIEIRGSAPAVTAAATFEWTTLPSDVLRVLRAGSILGTEFDVALIARLLDEPVGLVLEQLQRAADAGVALVDRGEGRFFLPEEAGQALQSQLLPSLQAFWHAQLGALLSDRHLREGEVLPEELAADETGIPQPEMPVAPERSLPTETPEPAAAEEDFTAGTEPSTAAYAEMFEPVPSSPEPAPEPPAPPDLAEPAEPVYAQKPGGGATRPERSASVSPQPQTDYARAAAHLEAAGQTEAAVEQYLAAVQEVAARGDARRAYAIAQQALKLLGEHPPSERRAMLRAQLLLALGHLQWQSAVFGTPFTLREALSSLEAARVSLPDTAPPEVAGQLAAITAGVCYDLGALDALQHALGELTTASRRLLEAGESTLAACLLNDQAAVYVRLGDPVRAASLLSKSRELFTNVLSARPNDAMAVEELAATEHLLARLPLHAQIRPGREADAYAISLDHARAAESAYQRLNQPRELGRVWETIGRLELRNSRLGAAQGRLSTALQLQKQIGDVTGLARSTAALAEVYIMANQLEDAAVLLADSITLNFEKGSPIGLAFNRRTFNALHTALGQMPGPAPASVHRTMEEVEQRLLQAESVLGRLVLPGETESTPPFRAGRE